MKNRFVDLPALFKRLDKKVRKWLVMMMEKRSNFIDRHEENIRKYLAGEDSVIHLNDYFSYLENDHLVCFEHAALNEGRMRWELLAIAARYGLAGQLTHATLAGIKKSINEVLLFTVSLIFGLLLLVGWRDETALLFQAIREGLDGHYVKLRERRLSYAPQFCLLLVLAADFYEQDIDRHAYQFLEAEKILAYTAALQEWRSPDLERVGQLVHAMADFHLANTQEEFSPFEIQSEYIFPYEILAFLRFREWAGLPSPTSYDHPLMNTPLAAMPPEPLSWPEIPLLDQAIAKFKTEYPENNYFNRLPDHPA